MIARISSERGSTIMKLFRISECNIPRTDKRGSCDKSNTSSSEESSPRLADHVRASVVRRLLWMWRPYRPSAPSLPTNHLPALERDQRSLRVVASEVEYRRAA